MSQHESSFSGKLAASQKPKSCERGSLYRDEVPTKDDDTKGFHHFWEENAKG